MKTFIIVFYMISCIYPGSALNNFLTKAKLIETHYSNGISGIGDSTDFTGRLDRLSKIRATKAEKKREIERIITSVLAKNSLSDDALIACLFYESRPSLIEYNLISVPIFLDKLNYLLHIKGVAEANKDEFIGSAILRYQLSEVQRSYQISDMGRNINSHLIIQAIDMLYPIDKKRIDDFIDEVKKCGGYREGLGAELDRYLERK